MARFTSFHMLLDQLYTGLTAHIIHIQRQQILNNLTLIFSLFTHDSLPSFLEFSIWHDDT